MDVIQKIAVMIYIGFNVTICLYLSLNDKARSLSTLMATIVNVETPHDTKLVIKLASVPNRKRFHTGTNECRNRISYFQEEISVMWRRNYVFFSCKAQIGFICLNKTQAKCSCHKKNSP